MIERIMKPYCDLETRELRCFKTDAFVSIILQNKNMKMTGIGWLFLALQFKYWLCAPRSRNMFKK